MHTKIMVKRAKGNLFVMFCAIWEFLKRKNQPWRSVTFVKSNTPSWVFFTFFKLNKWYQIAQRITFEKYFLSTATRYT